MSRQIEEQYFLLNRELPGKGNRSLAMSTDSSVSKASPNTTHVTQSMMKHTIVGNTLIACTYTIPRSAYQELSS